MIINVANVVKKLSNTEPIISEHVKNGKLKIVGARDYLDGVAGQPAGAAAADEEDLVALQL
jgi:hypothetical protein